MSRKHAEVKYSLLQQPFSFGISIPVWNVCFCFSCFNRIHFNVECLQNARVSVCELLDIIINNLLEGVDF